jgi:hypothetical protein
MHDFSWTTQLEYVTDIFSTLNGLNFALKGNPVAIFSMKDKVKAFMHEDEEMEQLPWPLKI